MVLLLNFLYESCFVLLKAKETGKVAHRLSTKVEVNNVFYASKKKRI